MWNDYDLPTTAEIDGIEYNIRSDYRDILNILKVFDDPNLLDSERLICALNIFYPQFYLIENEEESIRLMYLFINGNQEENNVNSNERPVMNWEQDLSIIIPPINQILNTEVRSAKYIHWWTFLGAYMEIGESTFSTYVSIREKKNKGKKLDKFEEDIYKKNRSRIDLKKKYDETTQSLLDEIMGKEG